MNLAVAQWRVLWVVEDRVPPGLVEGVAERESLAGEELVVPLLGVNPQS